MYRFVATLTFVSIITASKIHGTDVTDACLTAYKGAFEPELARTTSFKTLADAVTEPPEVESEQGQSPSTQTDRYSS